MDLTNSRLFQNLLELKLNNTKVDLHNDYTCVSVHIDFQELKLFFKKDTAEEQLSICFIDTIITTLSLPLIGSQGLTLDNFHRGRYELDNELYDTYKSKSCFYLEFYRGGRLELLCAHVFINMNP